MDQSYHVVCCMKDEGPFVLEWVAHYRVLGFDRIFVATNDCSDGTDEMLDRLQARGFVEHFPLPAGYKPPPQTFVYNEIYSQSIVQEADWLFVVDADEFLNIRVGDGSVRALTAKFPDDMDLLLINWANFGDGGHWRWQPGPVTSRFLLRLAKKKKVNAQFKTLRRKPGRFGKIGNHAPLHFKEDRPVNAYTCNGKLKDLSKRAGPQLSRMIRGLPQKEIFWNFAQLNHYATKTIDSFRLRAMRGRGEGGDVIRHTQDYFEERAGGRVSDTKIGRYRKRLLEEMAKMEACPEIHELQQKIEMGYQVRLTPHQFAADAEAYRGAGGPKKLEL